MCLSLSTFCELAGGRHTGVGLLSVLSAPSASSLPRHAAQAKLPALSPAGHRVREGGGWLLPVREAFFRVSKTTQTHPRSALPHLWLWELLNEGSAGMDQPLPCLYALALAFRCTSSQSDVLL